MGSNEVHQQVTWKAHWGQYSTKHAMISLVVWQDTEPKVIFWITSVAG